MHDQTAGISICTDVWLIPQNAVGVVPGAPTVALPDVEARLSQLEQWVGLLVAGTPLPPDVQRAQTCTQVSPQAPGLLVLAFAVCPMMTTLFQIKSKVVITFELVF